MNYKRKRFISSSGFSIIELITFIVIAGIFVPLAYIAFSSATKSAAVPEHVITARFIAEQKMEEITRNPFEGIIIESKCYPTDDPGPNVSVPTGYQLEWTVDKVDDYSSISSLIASADYANYKIITVNVKTPDNFEYKVYTIVTKRPQEP